MKTFNLLLLLGSLSTAVGFAQTADSAPLNFTSVVFNGTITAATGGANGAGTISSLFASNGLDYTLTAAGALTDPVPFTYVKTGASSARITEVAPGPLPAVGVALTFSDATTGTFVATYGNGSTQTGAFTLVPVGFAAPLVNASTRTILAPNGAAITGFVVGGSGSRRVLVRAVGPGIAQFGVANVLANPSISLWRGSTQIAANDDFDSGAAVNATLPAAFRSVGAFPLTTGSKDAALTMDLEPGSYTAQIRGGSATETGEVLLEVYFMN
ncbi:MAG: hypothetical protein H7343_04940 [Undibacterium sp.]|nr:hypothetical protein [Opitutaceae bacterium]